jgi:hypothetical protein
MSNFICPTCQKEHTIPVYSMKMDCKYYDNFGNILTCDCKDKSELISNTKWDGGCPTFGKFASMDVKGKSDVLKKRSKEHYKKEIKEKADFMNKQPII